MALSKGPLAPEQRNQCYLRMVMAGMVLSLAGVSSSLAEPIPQKIKDAVVKGSDYLLKSAKADGHFPGHHSDKIGNTALPVYALIKCSEPLDHPAIKNALPHLTRYAMTVNPAKDEFFTYNASSVLLTLDAVRDAVVKKRMVVNFRSRNESTGDNKARLIKRRIIKINIPKFVAVIRKLAVTLARTQNYDGGFGYKPNSRSDLSNTQYAALGMWAARRSGFKLNQQALTKMADWVMSTQKQPAQKDPNTTWQPTSAAFLYTGDDRPASTIMTGAGIGTLAVLHFELTKRLFIRGKANDGGEYESPGEQPKFRPADQKPKPVVVTKKFIKHPLKIKRAIDCGFKWWEESGFTIDNAYHFYTLERACVLTQTKEIGGTDWYHHVSERVVKTQTADGSWTNYNNADKNLATSWTLLFLVKATSQMLDLKPSPAK